MCVQGCVCSIKLPSPCLKRDGAERARVTNEAVEQKDKKAARTGRSQKGGTGNNQSKKGKLSGEDDENRSVVL